MAAAVAVAVDVGSSCCCSLAVGVGATTWLARYLHESVPNISLVGKFIKNAEERPSFLLILLD